MERSFKKEVQSLRLGAGQTFRGEGILAVTKALLQSGVAYVGGYQGAPVSHLVDVLVESQDMLDELGIHLETCANEASAAALLAASINYPLRGAVTWKSIVGTNVASDALSNLASAGVMGGALIVVGEDYGEGASVIQERSHAFALKSSVWLLDPRPNLPTIVDLVEKSFQLSEATNTPVMMELRIRACHVTGEFTAKDNIAPAYSRKHLLAGPAPQNYDKLSHPPATFRQEKQKHEVRLPAARKFILEHGLNEIFDAPEKSVGVIVQGGLYNAALRAMSQLGLADAFGQARLPVLVLNVTHPLVPEQIMQFCAGKDAVLLIEEGQPDYLEQALNSMLRRADLQTKIVGKDVLPMAGEYTAEVLADGVQRFVAQHAPHLTDVERSNRLQALKQGRSTALAALGGELPTRPPNFCTGCPERPLFTAIKLLQREIGPTHIATDIGCHSFATFAPFSLGNSILGYGMSLASAAGVAPMLEKRPIAVMGDGGFWHNGVVSGVSSSLFNRGDGVLVILQNGYTSATGAQFLPNSKGNRKDDDSTSDIETTLRAMGVTWLRTVRTYSLPKMISTLRQAMTTKQKGLKVIIADGECQLARQRRIKPQIAAQVARGQRVVRTRYGVDERTCTGDHACVRLSACPSLTIAPNPDPLKSDPVAHVDNDCVGCGLCGEVAHAAVLCPSFYRAEIIQNPRWYDRALASWRATVIGWLNGTRRTPSSTATPQPVAAE